MPPELNIDQAALLADMAMCLNHYRLFTPGLHVCVQAPVQLQEGVRITPGLVAQVNRGKHKQCDTGDYECFRGPPNFVFDAFKDDQVSDYESRRAEFERSGVIEYVAWKTSTELPTWNRLVDGRYKRILADDAGVWKSVALPGFWIPVEPLKNRDWWVVLATISRGTTRRGHREFMSTIWKL